MAARKTNAEAAEAAEATTVNVGVADTPAPTETVVTEIPAGAGFDDLLSDVSRSVVTWIPAGEGSKIAGLVKSREQITTEPEPGRKVTAEVTVLDVDLSDSSKPLVRVAWLGVVLETAVRRHDPQPGDVVALRQAGTVDTGRPRRDGTPGTETYADWRVVVRKAPLS
jgi:hypothetical protein